MTTRSICLIEPVGEPLTLAEAKLHLRTDNDTAEEDSLVTRLIKAARIQVEKELAHRVLPAQTRQMRMHYSPRGPYLQLDRAPVTAITSFTYTDADGVRIFAPEDYYLDLLDDNRLPVVRMLNGWPANPLVFPGGMQVTFTCGYTAIPAPLAEAMLALIAYWYNNREVAIASTVYKAEVALLPERYQELLRSYVLHP